MSSTDELGPGGRLKWAREQRAMTQGEMAEALGLSLRGYQNYERNARPLPASLMGPIHGLGIVPLWVLKGVGEPFVDEASTPIHLRGERSRSSSVREPAAAYNVSVSNGLMRSIIEEVQRAVQTKNLHLSPEKFADLCMLALELERGAETSDPAARVDQLLRLAL